MAGEAHAGPALGEVLAARRRRRFLGRAAEIELFRGALEGELRCSVLFVCGPGGVGKTSLLEVFADRAAGAGVQPVTLDGRDLAPSPAAVTQTLLAAGVPLGEGETPAIEVRDRTVILLDSYERLAPLDDWFRERVLPQLPATALTVVAGRTAPSPAWRADPAWRELLRIVSLRNLSAPESRRYLQECGVAAASHDLLVSVSHGHPLGLSLLADLAARGSEGTVDTLTPDVVGALLRRFLDVVPNELQRRALGVCALARTTTEPLLRAALGIEDAHDLFVWLQGLSIIESGPRSVPARPRP